MNKRSPIPKLDLAPKLNRPLSLWNPLDYLRLLYWVFFFPQALRWYVETYGGGESLPKQTTGQKKLEFLRQHPNQLKLWIQGLLLTVIVSFAFCGLLEQVGFEIEWSGVALGVVIGMVFGIRPGLSMGVAWGVAWGVTWGVVQVMFWGLGFWGGGMGVAGDVAWSVAMGVSVSVGMGVAGGVGLGVVLFVGLFVGSMVLFAVLSVVLDRGLDVGWSSLVLGVAIWRPENWLIYLPPNLQTPKYNSWLFPRITPIPLPLLEFRLKTWLRQNWLLGLQNANELLRYSLQFIPVVKAVNQVLAEIPSEQLIFRVSQLAENPSDWKLVKFASASLTTELETQFTKGILFCAFQNDSDNVTSNDSDNVPSVVEPRLDTPTRATAAGFWYLHEKKPEQATTAFFVVRSLLYGEEMFMLAQTLAQFKKAKKPDSIAAIQLPIFPSEPLLRPTTWDVVNSLRRVVEDVKIVLGGNSKSARSFALNRAMGELKNIIDNADNIPKAEQDLIVEIAQTWITEL